MKGISAFLKHWLEHPLTRGLDIDDPQTTVLRRRIIKDNKFLYRIYREWYDSLLPCVPQGEGMVLELGSGAGFLKEFLPNCITSDVQFLAGVDVIADGRALPVATNSLKAIVMVDVLHHIPNVTAFFESASRTVKPGGVVAMLEPWLTPWSRLIYSRFHHEPCDSQTDAWDFPAAGHLSSANLALPWVIFQRDQEIFKDKFPEWEISQVRASMPFRYLLSGGVSLRNLVPAWSYPLWARLEDTIQPLNPRLGMFAQIVLTNTKP